ncbi:metallophosphoesterase [Streptococcus pseudoporcinus]|uniref:Phosphoesterase n=1 Tax=Streptococcus pseudoporcinus LQ 940-04 TaxID=875093 RepID=G5K6J2_9STRE|nr:metallophosphoesterase [Streptococcus pseudoporcinus]EFR44787.1 putative phosphoesterase [Streptococcus pseudoporcinus SPIN 20026]EHI65896.1 putative phosphoesterase [Streptococcus pseudoporcinus LQ 940-04]VEF94546.1 phosphoesterase [Streptococcus pseudoporcinus]
MTKLAIMSDLHIDLNHFDKDETDVLITVLKEEAVDHLHLAGDLANHFEETAKPFLGYLNQFIKVTYNLGNHDMLDLSEDSIEASDFHIYPLSNDSSLLAIHGWYDYSFYPLKTEQENRAFKKTFWFDHRLKREQSDPQITDTICQKLERILYQLADKRLIVAMHFVPHQAFLLSYPKLKPFNAFLGSHKFHQIFVNTSVTDVVFGHNHKRIKNTEFDGITYHSKPLGYMKEWQLTDRFLKQFPHYLTKETDDPNKHFAAIQKEEAFIAYRQEHLAEEFRSAMTIFTID